MNDNSQYSYESAGSNNWDQNEPEYYQNSSQTSGNYDDAGLFFFFSVVGFIWFFANCVNYLRLKDKARSECDRNVELMVNQQRTRIATRETQNRREMDQYWRSDYALVHMNRARGTNSDRIQQEIGMRLADETPITSLLNVNDLPTYNEIQQQNRSATEESPPCYEECLINIVLTDEMSVH